MIPQKFAVPPFFELEAERRRTHRWTQIAKSKKVEYVGLMEEKVLEMGKELSELSEESTMREQLHAESRWLRKKLQEKETHLATMESLSMEARQCRLLSNSYTLFLKEQWM